jgi:hypothetical protein
VSSDNFSGADINFSGEALKHIGRMTWLKELVLCSATIDDADLEQLVALEKLSRLMLDYTGITDAGLQFVGRLTSLEQLELTFCRVTDNGLRHLRNLTALTAVQLDVYARTFPDEEPPYITDRGMCNG